MLFFYRCNFEGICCMRNEFPDFLRKSARKQSLQRKFFVQLCALVSLVIQKVHARLTGHPCVRLRRTQLLNGTVRNGAREGERAQIKYSCTTRCLPSLPDSKLPTA